MQGHMTLPSSLLRPVIRHRRPSAVGLAIAIAFRLAGFAVAENPSARTPNGSAAGDETLAVSTTFNHAPFTYQIRLVQERPEFRVYRLSYPSPVVTPVRQNNTVPAEYYLPKGAGLAGRRYPAVICMHILDGNEALTDLVCTVLASRSIPALSFKLPYYGQRGLPGGPKAIADNPERFAGAIAQAGEDVRRTVDLLASRPEIDPQRIGITGISLGGIIAATAIGGEPRLHRAALLLAGGDLLDIINHARETRPIVEMLARLPPAGRAAIEAKLTQVDPLRFAPAVRNRARAGRVLMINASQDEVVPRRCTEKLAEALGIADRVVWLEGLGHYTALAELPRALRITADFFAQDLPEEERDRPRPGASNPSPRCDDWSGCCTRRRRCCPSSRRRADATTPNWSSPPWAPIAGRSKGICGWSAVRKAGSLWHAGCRRSEKLPWGKAAFPGCSPAPATSSWARGIPPPTTPLAMSSRASG